MLRLNNFLFPKRQKRPANEDLGSRLDTQNNRTIIHSRSCGSFLVDFKKRRIDWKPSKKKSLSGLPGLIFRGKVLGMMVSRMPSYFVIHANAIADRRGAVLLTGAAGAGKSTLTAFLLNRGFSLLSDDASILREGSGGFAAEASVPELRLWPDLLGELKPSGIRGKTIFPGSAKRSFFLNWKGPWRHRSSSKPLRAIYRLERRKKGAIRIERLQGRRALLAILKNLGAPLSQNQRILSRQLATIVRLCETIPVKLLTYPSGIAHLPRVYEALRRDRR